MSKINIVFNIYMYYIWVILAVSGNTTTFYILLLAMTHRNLGEKKKVLMKLHQEGMDHRVSVELQSLYF